MTLSPEQKIAGVLVPLFALRREDDLGIGDVAALREFIDWAASAGFKLVQLLPINEVGGDNSPYSAISSVAIEPTTLHLAPDSPNELTEQDFTRIIAEFDLPNMRKGPVDYAQVKRLKWQLLEAAFANRKPDRAFDGFCEREKPWLDEYALFRASMEQNGGREIWDEWPQGQQASPERHMFFRYVQWIAREQWMSVKQYAGERGVALMGDIPFGVSYYSADVWARRREFALEWSGGAPPEPYFKDDEFTQKWGQNWGIPLYQWDVMRGNGFAWWRQRVRGVQHAFHLFRIDHVLGFYRIYAFPWRPERNAEFLPLTVAKAQERTGGRVPHFAPRDDSHRQNCEANRRDGEEYLRVVLHEAGETRVIGEDLGTVPPYVRPSLRSLGIAGFKIPQWEVYEGRITPGAEYERLSVATYATHDHKPVRAMWEEIFDPSSPTAQQSREELEKIARFAEITSLPADADYMRDFHPAIMRALFASNSWIATCMITDLLGRTERFNTPGVAGGNWTQRMHMTVAKLRRSTKVRQQMRQMRQMLEQTGRL